MTKAPLLLTDEQVQRYIADGFVVLDSGLPADFHAAVTDDLRFAMKHETPLPGDNLLPRIPMTAELLAAPAVHGAVASVLGPEFAWAPHRFPHNSEPLDADEPESPTRTGRLASRDRGATPAASRGIPAGRDPNAFRQGVPEGGVLTPLAKKPDPFENAPRMGKGSISGSGWHQDGHSRAGRSRWHTFRAANLFYFPHDTPVVMGPTRLLAGSHLYANLHGVQPQQAFMRDIPAGSVILADFDLGHAGTPNHTADSRYMLKFVALRQRKPAGPSWDHRDAGWRTPSDLLSPHELPQVWNALWNWLRGAPRTEASKPVADDPATLLTRLKSRCQGQRLAALYDLAALGGDAVPALIDALLAAAGQGRHVSPPQSDPAFHGASPDHLHRGFTHRQFTPEDAAIALAAIGEEAAAALEPLLRHDDPWIRMNAVYALGDSDAGLGDGVGVLLDDESDAVVRVALDAACCQPTFGADVVERLHKLLISENAAWRVPAMGAQWSVQDQIRYVAAWALTARASAPNPPTGVEPALIDALKDDTGYTPAVACEGLKRLGTVSALKAAVGYLQNYRWDPVHHRFWRAMVEARAKG